MPKNGNESSHAKKLERSPFSVYIGVFLLLRFIPSNLFSSPIDKAPFMQTTFTQTDEKCIYLHLVFANFGYSRGEMKRSANKNDIETRANGASRNNLCNGFGSVLSPSMLNRICPVTLTKHQKRKNKLNFFWSVCCL